tara:strand:- start:749 stop:934 length:186 start_codon:yes stop_codon:yes gene_type:complete
MASITIDGKEYDTDNLSDKAKEQVVSLQFVQAEIKRAQAQLAVYQTAASAYSQALKSELEN